MWKDREKKGKCVRKKKEKQEKYIWTNKEQEKCVRKRKEKKEKWIWTDKEREKCVRKDMEEKEIYMYKKIKKIEIEYEVKKKRRWREKGKTCMR